MYDILEQLSAFCRNYEQYEIDELIITAIVLMFCLLVFSYRRTLEYAKSEVKLRKSNQALEDALDEIKILKGVIPICMYCKNIRDEKGEWFQIEEYVRSRSEAYFSHDICPECHIENHPRCEKEFREYAMTQGELGR